MGRDLSEKTSIGEVAEVEVGAMVTIEAEEVEEEEKGRNPTIGME